IPEGQEWLLSYLAFNLGQYDGVFPCVNIGWCIDNDSSLYNYETGETYTATSSINAQTQTAGQLFTVPQGQVWNITNIGGWFYYYSPYGLDFFLYDSEFTDSIDFSEWDVETLNTTSLATENLEFFTNIQNDTANFIEDSEGFCAALCGYGGGDTVAWSDGVIVTKDNGADSDIEFRTPSISVDANLYHYLVLAFYGNDTGNIAQFFVNASDNEAILRDTTGWSENNWHFLFYDLTTTDCEIAYCNASAWNNTETSLKFKFDVTTSGSNISIDYFYLQENSLWNKLLLDRTYRDPRGNVDWFEVILGNATDFEDGSEEQFVQISGEGTIVGVAAGEMQVESTVDVTTSFRINTTELSINADSYNILSFDFRANRNVSNIVIQDSDQNLIIDDSTYWLENTNHTWSYNLSQSAFWTGTETNFYINLTFDDPSDGIAYFEVFTLKSAFPDGGFLEIYLSERRYETIYAREDNATLTNSNSMLCTSGFASGCWDSWSQRFYIPDGETWTIAQVGYENVSYHGSPTGTIGITGFKIEDLGGADGDDFVPDFSDIKASATTGTPTANGTAQYWNLPTPITLTSGAYFWFWNASSGDPNGYRLWLDTVDATSNTTYDLITLVIAGSTQFYKAATGDFFSNLRSNGSIVWNPTISWDAGTTEDWWINSDVYDNLTMRIMPTNLFDGQNENNASALDIIENATIYDFDGNQICFTNFSSTVLENGTWYDISCLLKDDPDWFGNERGFSIEFGLQVALDNTTGIFRDAIWIANITLLGSTRVNASIGIVGLDGSGFADWTDIQGYQNITESDMINGLVDTTSFTSITLDTSFLLTSGNYAWFLNYTNPIPSADLGEWRIAIAIDTPDNPTFTDIRYLNTTGWEIVSLDYLAQFNYTKQYDDFVPRGHIGIAGSETVDDYWRVDIDNIYWNASIGNLPNNNSWNYFALNETLILPAGDYFQYLWMEGDYAGCVGGGCTAGDPRRLYPNGYLLLSDRDSPESYGKGTDLERFTVWQYDRYADADSTPWYNYKRDLYWGINYTDVYNCATDCVVMVSDYFELEIGNPVNFADGTVENFTIWDFEWRLQMKTPNF
ncbi:MAG: hypothetical protein ACW99A_21290, partial [Candidatus Kariarchaeaceae archaeon]